MKLKFYSEEFPFELMNHTDTSIECRLLHNDQTRQMFKDLCDAEEEVEDEDGPWYLDEKGERLEANELFLASPWSLEFSGM